MSTNTKQTQNFLKKHRGDFLDYIANYDTFEFLEMIKATEKHGHSTTKEEFNKIKSDEKINVSSVINMSVYAEYQLNNNLPSKTKKLTGLYPRIIELKLNDLIINLSIHTEDKELLFLEPFEIYDEEGHKILNNNDLNDYINLIKKEKNPRYIIDNILNYYRDNRGRYNVNVEVMTFEEEKDRCLICVGDNEELIKDVARCGCKNSICEICYGFQMEINGGECLICHEKNTYKIFNDLSRKDFKNLLKDEYFKRYTQTNDYKNIDKFDDVNLFDLDNEMEELTKHTKDINYKEIRYIKHKNDLNPSTSKKTLNNILIFELKNFDLDEHIKDYLIDIWLNYGFHNYYLEFVNNGFKGIFKLLCGKSATENNNDGLKMDDEEIEDIKNLYNENIDWLYLIPHFKNYLSDDYNDFIESHFNNLGFEILKSNDEIIYIFKGDFDDLLDESEEKRLLTNYLFTDYENYF